jgi:hypothetical protein
MWTPGSSISTTRSTRTTPGCGRRSTSASPSTSPNLFGLDGLSARALQKYFYHRYGTTLRALIDEYDVDPYDFLDFAHDIDHSDIELNASLGAAIERLPGRKLILTNGSRKHAENVARKIGILDHFEDVFDIAASTSSRSPTGGPTSASWSCTAWIRSVRPCSRTSPRTSWCRMIWA